MSFDINQLMDMAQHIDWVTTSEVGGAVVAVLAIVGVVAKKSKKRKTSDVTVNTDSSTLEQADTLQIQEEYNQITMNTREFEDENFTLNKNDEDILSPSTEESDQLSKAFAPELSHLPQSTQLLDEAIILDSYGRKEAAKNVLQKSIDIADNQREKLRLKVIAQQYNDKPYAPDLLASIVETLPSFLDNQGNPREAVAKKPEIQNNFEENHNFDVANTMVGDSNTKIVLQSEEPEYNLFEDPQAKVYGTHGEIPVTPEAVQAIHSESVNEVIHDDHQFLHVPEVRNLWNPKEEQELITHNIHTNHFITPEQLDTPLSEQSQTHEEPTFNESSFETEKIELPEDITHEKFFAQSEEELAVEHNALETTPELSLEADTSTPTLDLSNSNTWKFEDFNQVAHQPVEEPQENEIPVTPVNEPTPEIAENTQASLFPEVSKDLQVQYDSPQEYHFDENFFKSSEQHHEENTNQLPLFEESLVPDVPSTDSLELANWQDFEPEKDLENTHHEFEEHALRPDSKRDFDLVKDELPPAITIAAIEETHEHVENEHHEVVGENVHITTIPVQALTHDAHNSIDDTIHKIIEEAQSNPDIAEEEEQSEEQFRNAFGEMVSNLNRETGLNTQPSDNLNGPAKLNNPPERDTVWVNWMAQVEGKASLRNNYIELEHAWGTRSAVEELHRFLTHYAGRDEDNMPNSWAVLSVYVIR